MCTLQFRGLSHCGHKPQERLRQAPHSTWPLVLPNLASGPPCLPKELVAVSVTPSVMSRCHHCGEKSVQGTAQSPDPPEVPTFLAAPSAAGPLSICERRRPSLQLISGPLSVRPVHPRVPSLRTPEGAAAPISYSPGPWAALWVPSPFTAAPAQQNPKQASPCLHTGGPGPP